MAENILFPTTVVATTQPNHSSSIQSVLSSGNQDVFVEMELFFAEAASLASTSAVEVMKRARASRAANDAKKAFQSSGVPDGNNFRYGSGTLEVITQWFNEYTEGTEPDITLKQDSGIKYDSAVVQQMIDLKNLLSKPDEKERGLLTPAQKSNLENIILPTFKLDENKQEVLSDEIMTVMLQQANALYQSWLSGFQKISTSRVETLKELIRALS